MDKELVKNYTLSAGNPFLWSYDGNEIFVLKEDKNGTEYTFTFNNDEIDGLMEYINKRERVPLGNSVSKVIDGTEKDGIGTYIYSNIAKNTSIVQTASQLVSILYNTNVLYYNNQKKSMEFWINNRNWKEQLLKYMKIYI